MDSTLPQFKDSGERLLDLYGRTRVAKSPKNSPSKLALFYGLDTILAS
jgi:hypothetical protein